MQAFDYAKELVAGWLAGGKAGAKLCPRLRDFQPALVGYALTGQADKAQEVIDMALQYSNADLTGEQGTCWDTAFFRLSRVSHRLDGVVTLRMHFSSFASHTWWLIEVGQAGKGWEVIIKAQQYSNADLRGEERGVECCFS